MIPALSNAGVPAIVRVPWNEPSVIMKALDAGAQGVIVPMVNSPEEARAAAEACRFPPHGIRSWGPARPTLYAPDYTPETANRQVICAVMVETVTPSSGSTRSWRYPASTRSSSGPATSASPPVSSRRRTRSTPSTCG